MDASQGDDDRARIVVLIGIVLLATLLRGACLDRSSLYYDEVVVLNLAREPDPGALLDLLLKTDATRAPLHPLLMQAWLLIFGTSSVSARAFSVACGVLTVLVVERIGRRAFDVRTGLLAAFLFAMSPMQIRYAQEVRMYALLVLETCLAWNLLLSFRGSAPPGKQVQFFGWLVALGYTHPLGLFMDAALGIAYLVQPSSFRLGFGRWLAIQVAAVAAILPWAIHYVDHPPEFAVGRLPIKFLFGLPIGYIGGNALTLLGFLALIVYGTLGRRSGSKRLPSLDHPRETTTLLVWFAVPPLLLFGHSLISTTPIFGPPRYTLFVGPAYLLLVARGLARLPAIPRYGVAVACTVLAGALLQPLVYRSIEKADWRQAAAYIGKTGARSPVVVLVDPPKDRMEVVPLRYYLDPTAELVPISEALKELDRDPEALGGSVWSIVDHGPDGRPKVAPPPGLLRRFEPVDPRPRIPGVDLIRYRLRPLS